VVHRLVRNGIALLTAHTNADCAVNGVSDALALALGVVNGRPLEPMGDVGEGLGRIGELPNPMLLTDFAEVVARSLPFTPRGINIAGDLTASVQRVAVCGGSGDSLLAVADNSGADVFVTADLKHHKTLEHLQAGGCAVIDVSHWASEWPWLLTARESLQSALRHLAGGDTVEIMVSEECTDPWTAHRVSE
jgi:putative NIF3 family GTP cyclohydrolase 1 type 2